MPSNQKWYCDACGKSIGAVKDGWVEWVTFKDSDGDEKGGDFRLVHNPSVSARGGHRPGCGFEESPGTGRRVYDWPLEIFVGVDGLMLLLSYVAEEKIPCGQVLEMIKRLHIPGYEEARKDFAGALEGGVIRQNWYPGFYSQEQIRKVISHVRPVQHPEIRAQKPSINVVEGFTEADLCQLLETCDDLEGRHILWVDQGGNIDISLLPADVVPAKWAESMGSKLKFRYETFQSGSGYVGYRAAKDREWATELAGLIRRDWITGKNGCIGF